VTRRAVVSATPDVPAAAAAPPRLLTTEACRPAIRRALATDPLVVLVGRASSPSGSQATDLAASSVINGATELERREGIRVRHLLPALAELKAHHRTTAIREKIEALDGGTIAHRWSTWGGPQVGVLVIMTTGTGTKIALEHFEQPAVARVARLVHAARPAVVYARALHRIGRGSLDPLIEVLQHIAESRVDGPFIGDDTIRLGELDEGMERRLADQSISAKYRAQELVNDNRVGMRSRTGESHEFLPGVWEYGAGQPPPPGLTTLRLRTYDNAVPRTALVLDCPAARPPEHLIAGGRPPARTPTGKFADQVALVRWLGEHLYTDGWGARACAAYLAAHGWAPPAIRRRRKVEVKRVVVKGKAVQRVTEAPAVPLRSGYAGRTDGRRALQAFLQHLDFYVSGELDVKLPDGEPPVHITGVLPLDGRPWITATQAKRIRDADPRRHSGPRNKHLFAGLPVPVDGQPAVLYPRERPDGELVYYFRRADDPRRPVTGPRAKAIPPLPAGVLAEWYAEALAELALPLSLRLAEQPPTSNPWELKIHVLTTEIAKLEADRAAQEREINPATRTIPPRSLAYVRNCYEQTMETLEARREALELTRRQERLHRGSPILAGAPLSMLVALAAALPRPYDQGHRLLLRDLTAHLAITTTQRRSIGRRPAHDLHAVLTLRVQDGTDSWEANSQRSWTGGAIRRTPARLAAAIDGLYAGVPLVGTLGVDWPTWLPAIRAALGCTGKFAFAYARDARLLRLGMAVVYPRRAALLVPEEPGQIVRYAGPPVDPADLPRLARRLHEPVALLRAIHDSYTRPRLPRWIHNASPAVTAAYAAAAHSDGRLPLRQLPHVLHPAQRERPGAHRLAREWTPARCGLAVLQPCRRRNCGGTRRAVMRVREVTGSLCLDCRTDRADVRWDPSYDRFIDQAPQWD
jgi:hypothetical protein